MSTSRNLSAYRRVISLGTFFVVSKNFLATEAEHGLLSLLLHSDRKLSHFVSWMLEQFRIHVRIFDFLRTVFFG